MLFVPASVNAAGTSMRAGIAHYNTAEEVDGLLRAFAGVSDT
jgi:selenocysteine lyase/cysteine desulfurase